MSVQHSHRLYRDRVANHARLGPIVVITIFTAVLMPSIVRAMGVSYSLSNVVANLGILVLIPLSFVLSMIQAKTQDDRQLILNAAFLSLPLFVTVNVVALAAGISNPNRAEASEMLMDERMNQTLALVGISMMRTSFPIASGTNVFGAVAALSTLICLYYTVYSRGAPRWFALAVLPVNIAALILTDARGATAATILCAMMAGWALRNPLRIRLLYIPVLLTPFFPSIAYRLFDLANNSSALSFLVRSGTQGARLGVGTGRGEIWNYLTTRYQDFQWEHLIGYGAFGHVSSRLSAGYAWIFNDMGVTLMGSHNSFLQYLIDTGYLGAIIWLALLLMFVYHSEQLVRSATPKAYKAVIVSFTFLLIVQSQTETFGTLYTPEILTFLTIALLAIGFLTRSGETSPASAPQADKRSSFRWGLPAVRPVHTTRKNA